MGIAQDQPGQGQPVTGLSAHAISNLAPGHMAGHNSNDTPNKRQHNPTKNTSSQANNCQSVRWSRRRIIGRRRVIHIRCSSPIILKCEVTAQPPSWKLTLSSTLLSKSQVDDQSSFQEGKNSPL